MNAIHATKEPSRTTTSGPWRWVLAGGIVAATLDLAYITSAFWFVRDVPGYRILQAIAGGLLGREAYQGGAATAWLGALLHYSIATAMVVAYYLVSRHWRVLVRKPLPYGIAYGVFLYYFMQWLVLPYLSAAYKPPSQPDPLLWTLGAIGAHAFLVGPTAAFFSRRAIASSSS